MVRYSLHWWKETGLVFPATLSAVKRQLINELLAVISLTVDTEMLAFVFDNWLEICFFMVTSIRVAHLLAYCVLIGSSAELYLAFCMQNVLPFLQMVDAITGKVMLSMVIILAFKVHCDTQIFHGLVPRTRSCSGLLSLLYSTAPGSD